MHNASRHKTKLVLNNAKLKEILKKMVSEKLYSNI